MTPQPQPRESFFIVARGVGAIRYLEVHGELDLATSPELLERVDEHPEAHDIRLDLFHVSFIDSSALGALVRLKKSMTERGGSVRIDRQSDAVRRLLELTRLQDGFS